MDLVNQLPVAASVRAAPVEGAPYRFGLVTAKATFRFDSSGRITQETQKPRPLLKTDEPTPFGLLPGDLQPRRDPAFEVMILGQAHAPRPTPSLTVALAVGDVRRELRVSGERVWHGQGPQAAMTRPQPFERMPLTWDRAFGGSHPVYVDRESIIDVSHPINKYGKGFDVEAMARSIAQSWKAPAGFPVLPGYQRALPNLEDPQKPVRSWDDSPEPTCWAPIPLEVPLRAGRLADEQAKRASRRGWPQAETDPLASIDGPPPDLEENYLRAHPDWVIALPPAGALVRLENLHADAAVIEFRLPQLHLVADWSINGGTGRLPLAPQVLMLLPEENTFYIVFRASFMFDFERGKERCLRLRSEKGWFQPARREPELSPAGR